MSKPVLGVQLFTIRKFCSSPEALKEAFRRITDMGYTSVQVSGLGDLPADAIAEALQESGLNAAITHMGWPRFLKDLDNVIAEHKMWNCTHAAVGGLPGEYFCSEGIEKFVSELGPIAARLSEEGMDFSYHNHNHELEKFDGETWLARVYKTAGHDILKAEIDTYWIQAGGGDPAQWIRMCKGRMPVVHLKDMCIAPGREQRFAPIGEGNLNWAEILPACEEAGVEYLMIEQDNCYDEDPFDCLATSYRNLSAMGYK